MAFMRVATDRLRRGMRIRNNVYSKGGAILIPDGTPVSREVIELLTKHFIDFVMVDYKPLSGAPEVLSPVEVAKVTAQQMQRFEQTFQMTEETLSQNFKDIVENNKELDEQTLLDMLSDIVETSGGDVNLCDMLLHMRKSSEGLYAHSINVALLGQILAKWMNYSEREIQMVATAGLIHDIGLLKVNDNADLPSDFSFKDELDPGPYDRHPILAYNMLKGKNIDSMILQAILTHHERLDETGFPLQIKGANINPISRVLAIVDTYDTLSMPQNGKTTSPFWLLRDLENYGYHKYDSKILMTFITKLTNNFIKHNVRLSNGLTGQIVLINKYNLTRPLVQVGKSSFIDLSTRKDLSIIEVLD